MRAVVGALTENERPPASRGGSDNSPLERQPHQGGCARQTRKSIRGRARVQMHAFLVAAAYNLVRIAKLSPAPA